MITFQESLRNITSECHFKLATKQLNSQSQKLDKKPNVCGNLVASAFWYKYRKQFQPWYAKEVVVGFSYACPPLFCPRDMFQDSPWMPKITDSTKPRMYYVFSYTYLLMIKLNL